MAARQHRAGVRRVYVHGVGVVSPWGALGATWDALLRGDTAVAPATTFDAAGMPCPSVAAVPGLADEADPRRVMATTAAAAADPRGDGVLGVFVGAESGRARFPTLVEVGRRGLVGGRFDAERFQRGAAAVVERVSPAVASPHAVAVALAEQWSAEGPVETFSQACASGLAAVVEAVRALRAGECDRALVGGVGADADPLMHSGFGKLGALSPTGVARPFDGARDGFVIGEGAAFVVLSTAPSDVVVRGVGRGHEAHHLVAPDPTGLPARRVIAEALRDGGSPGVAAVLAHGTGTPHNDLGESLALRSLFGDDLPVASVKGALGHWIAGAGALNLALAVLVTRARLLPPTTGLRRVDPACGVRASPGEQALGHGDVVTTAFAFGGALSAAVVGRA